MKTFFLLTTFILLSGCQKTQVRTYRQIDRVGRPFLQQTFLSTHETMTTANSVLPTEDLAAASATVQSDYTTVFGLFSTYATSSSLSPISVTNILQVFFPDIIRIDTTLTTTPVGTWGYNVGTTLTIGGTILIGGRKIEDDVWDITANYLLAGSLTGGPATAVSAGADRVCYEGSSSSRCSSASARLQGHSVLFGASDFNGTASFPFLPAPN